MRHTLFLFSLALTALVCVWGCTDYPLSTSTSITDKRLIGFWQENDSSGFLVKEDPERKNTYQLHQYYKSGKFWAESFMPVADLFFATFKDGADKVQFMSVGNAEDESFNNARFSFINDERLEMTDLSVKFLAANLSQNKDELVVKVGSTERFAAFVKKNLRNPSLYASTKIFQKVNNPQFR